MHLHLLSVPRLELESGTAHVLERRDAVLLAWLALEGATPRERVAQLVWPESATLRAAKNNLRQRVFRLRKAIGRDVVVADTVLRLAHDIRHDLDAIAVRLRDDPHACAGELLGALDYDDCAELAQWVRAVRLRWRTTRRDTLDEIAGQFEGERHIAQALRYAKPRPRGADL